MQLALHMYVDLLVIYWSDYKLPPPTYPPSHTVCIKQLLYFCSKMTQICLCSVVAVRDGSNQLHLVQPSFDAEANNYITSRCKTQCYYVIEFLLLLMSFCYWFIAIELSLLFYCFSMLLLLCCCYWIIMLLFGKIWNQPNLLKSFSNAA